MTYRLVWILIVGGLIALALWIATSLEPVIERVDSSFRGEALRNPYFAAREVLGRLELPTRTLRDVTELFPLPANDHVVVIPGHRSALTERRHAALAAWVEQGGHLVVAASRLDDVGDGEDDSIDSAARLKADPLLAPLGVRREPIREDGQDNQDKNGARSLPGKGEAYDDEILYLGPERIRVAWNRPWEQLRWDGSPVDVHQVGSATVGVELRMGQGRITALLDFHPFVNRSLAEEENAAGLLYLLTQHRQPAAVWIVISDAMPSLVRWLFDHYLPVLGPLMLLLALWLWRSAPRFGPVRQELVYETRSLAAHLAAAGRYYWRQDQGGRCLSETRANLWSQLARQFGLPGRAEPDGLERAGKELSLDRATLRIAFVDEANSSADFIRTTRALKRIEGRLHERR